MYVMSGVIDSSCSPGLPLKRWCSVCSSRALGCDGSCAMPVTGDGVASSDEEDPECSRNCCDGMGAGFPSILTLASALGWAAPSGPELPSVRL